MQETIWNISPLLSSETEETYVDTDRRKSVYRTIVDPTLFGLVENLMAVINEGDNEYQYVLWKNGVRNKVICLHTPAIKV